MVVCRDNSVLAQLGTPDMRVPIAYGLAFPERIVSGAAAVDFTRIAPLAFEAPDDQRFPGLPLAWAALRAAPGTTAVLNAANEVAVAAFLDGTIRFDQIHSVNAATLDAVVPERAVCESLEALLALDARARDAAGARVKRSAR
jgi:1-deoxy-D-xylulose-5-phosphate reductoisomerase